MTSESPPTAPSPQDPSDPRERLLDAAERLFGEHGYAGVKLRDLAHAAGLHHSTLYHHAPGGKTQLFAEATERSTARHAAALRATLETDAPLRERLRRAARWVLANPPANHTRLIASDLDQLPPDVARALGGAAWDGLIVPFADALQREADAGRARFDTGKTATLAGGLLAALQALQSAHGRFAGPDDDSAAAHADALIDVLVDGLRPRPDDPSDTPPDATPLPKEGTP